MKKYLFYFALICWTLSLATHLLAVADIDITEKAPFVWLLHVGVFIVWIPVVLNLKDNEEYKEYKRSGIKRLKDPFIFYRIIFKDTPKWMAVIAIAGFVYAMINFMLFMNSQPGTADIRDGQYILHDHGKFIRTLTEQEYNHYQANVVRGFSGHWILFYGVATAFLYKFSGIGKNPETIKEEN